MKSPAWLDARAVIAGLAIAGATASLGAAVDVRDRVAKAEYSLHEHEAVQDVQFLQIRADLAAIKSKLGIIP